MNKQRVNIELKWSGMQQTAFHILLLFGIYSFSSPAFAQSVVGSVLCSVYGLISFDIIRGLACLAVISLGVGAMLGRVTWGQAATVLAGTGGVFGALALAFAVMPVNTNSAFNGTLCAGQATTAQIQSAGANFIWSALGWVAF